VLRKKPAGQNRKKLDMRKLHMAPPPPSKGKDLPKAIETVAISCNYSLVKFRERDEAYRANGQLAPSRNGRQGTGCNAQVNASVYR